MPTTPVWHAQASPHIFPPPVELGLKSEIPVNPVNPATDLPDDLVFSFDKPSPTGKVGHGQSQCDKCGWNFDNESFLQVRRNFAHFKVTYIIVGTYVIRDNVAINKECRARQAAKVQVIRWGNHDGDA
jgi:hypothetical protein